MVYLPRGITVRQKVNPARINLPEAMEKLRGSTFTGYLRFDSPQGSGVILFEGGRLISATYISQDDNKRLIAYDAIARIFEMSILGDAELNIFRLSEDLVLSVHALLHGRYLERGRLLAKVDIDACLRQIKTEALTCCLRVYNSKKTALILYDSGHALGFFHDGNGALVTDPDVENSIAHDAQARFDMLEVRGADQLVLADLMGSANLGPIWQRARKALLEERRQREESAIRSQQQQQEKTHLHLFNIFKTVAGNHIGKFGVAQVEKAYGGVSEEMTTEQLSSFYTELEKLARLVAAQPKIDAMLDEMKKQASGLGR